jgi:hypothetical protein
MSRIILREIFLYSPLYFFASSAIKTVILLLLNYFLNGDVVFVSTEQFSFTGNRPINICILVTTCESIWFMLTRGEHLWNLWKIFEAPQGFFRPLSFRALMRHLYLCMRESHPQLPSTLNTPYTFSQY